MTTDLSVDIGPLTLKNPVLLASGTCGYGLELEGLLDIEALGGIVVKGLSLLPRQGNPPPRIAETPCGLLNSIGLENIGVEAFIEDRLPELAKRDVAVIVNILGSSIEEYGQIAQRLNGTSGIDALEVNISCPNVTEGGVVFGSDPGMAAKVTRAVRKAYEGPVIVKLSPNVTDITEIARAVESEGADAVSLINTLLGMTIDIERRRPVLSNVFGGLSGPAIRPVALRMVWQVVRAVKIPVIGIGGIQTASDALEFLLAGARAIQIGTATLVDPGAGIEVLNGIKLYMEKMEIEKVEALSI